MKERYATKEKDLNQLQERRKAVKMLEVRQTNHN